MERLAIFADSCYNNYSMIAHTINKAKFIKE